MSGPVNSNQNGSAIGKLYSVTKTVSFYAEGDLKVNKVENKELTSSFVDKIELLNNSLNILLKNENHVYNKFFKVRKKWAREFCNNELRQFVIEEKLSHEQKNKTYKETKDLSLDTQFIHKHINNWFQILDTTKDYFQQYLEFATTLEKISKEEKVKIVKAKKTDLNVFLKKLAQSSVLPSIIQFLIRSKNKSTSNSDSLVSETQLLATELLAESHAILSGNLVDSMVGSRVIRGSFNYFAVNKLSDPLNAMDKEGYIQKKAELESKLNSHCNSFSFDINCLENSGKSYYISDDKKSEDLNAKVLAQLTLKMAADKLKNFKSEQKRVFNLFIDELISQKYDSKMINCEDIFKKFPLFSSEKESLEKYYNDTIKIKELSEKYNQNPTAIQKEEIKNFAINRGKYFTHFCINYDKICKLYESIRKKEGPISGDLKNLEEKQLESQTLTHWALLVNVNNQMQLILVPKSIRSRVRELILKEATSKIPIQSEIENYVVFYEMKSLTVSALMKQVITNKTFHTDIVNCNGDEILEDKVKIRYCMNELINSPVIKTEDYKINLEVLGKHSRLNHFAKALESDCYFFKKYFIPRGDLKKITKGLEILTLNSFDLAKRPDKNRENKESHTELWDKFQTGLLNDNFHNVRLNPEFNIRHRNILSTEKTTFTRLGQIVEKSNRRNQPKNRIFLTITELSNKPAVRTNKINYLTYIDEFNETFNLKQKPKFFDKDGFATFYGIDRGSDEMATLCKVKLNPNIIYSSPAKNNSATKPMPPFPLYEPKFVPFEFYRLKNEAQVFGNYELQKILKNPSYYLSEFEENKIKRIDTFYKYFELANSSCLDLTRAKLFKSEFHNSNIILEVGDLYTYLNFALETAKSKIYTLVLEKGLDINELLWKDNTLMTNESKICFWNDLNWQSQEEIKKILDEYILDLRKKRVVSKDEPNALKRQKLWNLKKSLSANMIGIISHLYSLEPGFIVLENLNTTLINNQTKEETAIHRQLEQAFYQKWQNYSTVPPKINMPNMWKELFEITKGEYNQKYKDLQLGNMLLVNESGTSNTCPNCGTSNKEYGINEKKDKKGNVIKTLEEVINKLKEVNPEVADQKWFQHRFGCVGNNTGNCGFDTGSRKVDLPSNLGKMAGLNTSDSVAAYNIAKRGLELITKKQNENQAS